VLMFVVLFARGNDKRYLEADFRRLLHALQNCGQVCPFSTLLAAFASFHSDAHFFWRSRAASCPALGSFVVLAFLSGVLACAVALETSCGTGAVISPTASTAANITFCMSDFPLFPKVRALAAGIGDKSATYKTE